MLMMTIPRSSWDVKFRIFGVDARVHPSFWVGSVILAWSGQNGMRLMALVALIFVSIFVHEMGHALVGKYYGDRRPSIVLWALGGFYEPGRTARHGQAIRMLLAGPGAGFVQGLIALAVYYAAEAKMIPMTDLAWDVLLNALLFNFGWGTINLIPVYFLDGGRILQEVLTWKRPTLPATATYTFSMYMGIGVAMAGLVAYLTRLPYIGHAGWYIGLLFGILAYQNYRFRKLALENPYDEPPRQPWEQDPDWWKK